MLCERDGRRWRIGADGGGEVLTATEAEEFAEAAVAGWREQRAAARGYTERPKAKAV